MEELKFKNKNKIRTFLNGSYSFIETWNLKELKKGTQNQLIKKKPFNLINGFVKMGNTKKMCLKKKLP